MEYPSRATKDGSTSTSLNPRGDYDPLKLEVLYHRQEPAHCRASQTDHWLISPPRDGSANISNEGTAMMIMGRAEALLSVYGVLQ